jgi:hypothetical protein
MARALSFVLLLCIASAYAQRNDVWSNPALAGRGLSPGEQQLVLRQDMSACHGVAFERANGVPDEEKRKALGIALFKQCMSEKGWHARRAPRETAT